MDWLVELWPSGKWWAEASPQLVATVFGSSISLFGVFLAWRLSEGATNRRAGRVRRADSVNAVLDENRPLMSVELPNSKVSTDTAHELVRLCQAVGAEILRFGVKEEAYERGVSTHAAGWSARFYAHGDALNQDTTSTRWRATHEQARADAMDLNASLMRWMRANAWRRPWTRRQGPFPPLP